MGAAEDGRAPTEELSCVRGWDFCPKDICSYFTLNNTVP